VVGVLSVALASLCLQLMSALLDDLLVECAAQEGCQPIKVAQMNIQAKNTALERASTFLGVAPLNQLLFYLATITYRKVSARFFLIYVLNTVALPCSYH